MVELRLGLLHILIIFIIAILGYSDYYNVDKYDMIYLLVLN